MGIMCVRVKNTRKECIQVKLGLQTDGKDKHIIYIEG